MRKLLFLQQFKRTLHTLTQRRLGLGLGLGLGCGFAPRFYAESIVVAGIPVRIRCSDSCVNHVPHVILLRGYRRVRDGMGGRLCAVGGGWWDSEGGAPKSFVKFCKIL